MKTQNSKLSFKTNDLVELNDNQMLETEGGTTPACAAAAVVANASSAGCASVAAAIVAWLFD
ncbi:hypothetical protein [Pontimicrobium sp. MEBiC01747]